MAHIEEKTEPWQKVHILEEAVMAQTPSEVAELYSSLGKVEFTARALGLACHYCGLDMVRALVEGGAKFTYDFEAIKPLYKRAKHNDEDLYPGENFATALTSGCYATFDIDLCVGYKRPMLPIDDRLRILSYLYKTADKTGFDGDELLFFAYLSGEQEITELLKKHGAVISQKWIDIITNGNNAGDKWGYYCWRLKRLSNEDFFSRLTAIISEIGERKLRMTELFWEQNKMRLGMPGYMKFLFENFDLSKMNKTMLMKEIIASGDIECLEIIANDGWLKQPKKRDEMITFATENNKTECAAWLLDFKNRTADLAAERARAEKKAQRELNAAPDSETVLKQFWSFKKRPDGSVIITGYKGNKTEFTVPSRIGRSEVREIDMLAFSPLAPRLSSEVKELRRTITGVTLPGTVRKIGEQAFTLCRSLETVIIPEGVNEFGFHVFSKCANLESVELPRSLAKVDDVMEDSGLNMFDGSPNVTAAVYPESFAEEYCKRNNIPFIYNET